MRKVPGMEFGADARSRQATGTIGTASEVEQSPATPAGPWRQASEQAQGDSALDQDMQTAWLGFQDEAEAMPSAGNAADPGEASHDALHAAHAHAWPASNSGAMQLSLQQMLSPDQQQQQHNLAVAMHMQRLQHQAEQQPLQQQLQQLAQQQQQQQQQLEQQQQQQLHAGISFAAMQHLHRAQQQLAGATLVPMQLQPDGTSCAQTQQQQPASTSIAPMQQRLHAGAAFSRMQPQQPQPDDTASVPTQQQMQQQQKPQHRQPAAPQLPPPPLQQPPPTTIKQEPQQPQPLAALQRRAAMLSAAASAPSALPDLGLLAGPSHRSAPLTLSSSLPASSSLSGEAPASSAELHACLAAPTREEEDVQQLLASSRRQLEALRLDAEASRGALDFRKKHADMVRAMQRAVEQLEAAASEQRRLHDKHRLLRLGLALAEREALWLQSLPPAAAAAAARRSVAAPPPSRALGPAGGAYPASSGNVVSIHQLPSASEWDPSRPEWGEWEARVRDLRVLDLLLLHKQWLNWAAVKLQRVRGLRGSPEGDAAAAELAEMHARYNCLTQRVLRLAPEAWHESAKYDLDTLAPMPEPPTAEMVGARGRELFPEIAKKLAQVSNHYQRLLLPLRAEQAQLQQRYAALEQASQQASGAGSLSGLVRSSYSAVERVAVAAEAAGVMEEIDANLRQQELQLCNCLHAANFAVPADELATVRLMLYPMALNGQMVHDRTRTGLQSPGSEPRVG